MAIYDSPAQFATIKSTWHGRQHILHYVVRASGSMKSAKAEEYNSRKGKYGFSEEMPMVYASYAKEA